MVQIANTLVNIPQASNSILDIIANSANLTSVSLSPDFSSNVGYVPGGATSMQDVFGFVGRDSADPLGFLGFGNQIADESSIGGPEFNALLGQSETQVVFAIGDTNVAGGSRVTYTATFSFDISSATSLTDIQMSFAAEGDWEAYTGTEDPFDNADGLDATDTTWDVIEILGRIDGGATFTVFAPQVDEAMTVANTRDNGSTYTESDPFVLNGVAIGSGTTPGGRSLQDFSSTAVNGLSGSTLDLIVRANTNGGETMIFDNVIINGSSATPTTLSISFNDASISENGGTTTGTVTRVGDTSGALTVSLSSDDIGEATVPTAVQFLAGESTATFTVTGVNDALDDGTQAVTIRASAVAAAEVTQTLNVVDDEVAIDTRMPAVAVNYSVQNTGVFPSAGSTSSTPLGTINTFAFAAEQGADTNGALLAINSNTALFALTGPRFGGNGATTFAMPDLEGVLAVGNGSGAGLTSRATGDTFGSDEISLSQSNFPATLGGSSASGSNVEESQVINYYIATQGTFPSQIGSTTSPGFLGQMIAHVGELGFSDGWVKADGRLLNISQNTALFSILGTTYGGNGFTTFALPDLQGRVPVGVGQGPGLSNVLLGEKLGSENFDIQNGNLPSSVGGNDAAINNYQPSLGINYLVALTGVFPSGSTEGSEFQLGQIVPFAGNFAPTGFAFAHGQTLSITQNTALFALIGTIYGGDGVTTFALPDLRGQALVDNGGTISLGDRLGTPEFLLTDVPFSPIPAVTSITEDAGLPGDGLTTDTTLAISGTALAGAEVSVLLDGVAIGTATADGSGNWTLDHTGTPLALGSYTITAKTVVNGIASDPSPGFAISILDSLAPTATGVPTLIALTEDTQTEIDLSAVSFADVDTATITVTLTVSAGAFAAPADGFVNSVTATLLNPTTITLVGSPADISSYLDTISNIQYTPAADANGTPAATLALTANDGDGSGDVGLGTVELFVSAVNDLPVFANLDGTPAFTEGGAAQVLDGDVTLSDPDLAALSAGSGDFNGASLVLVRNGGPDTNDAFSIQSGGNLTVSGSNISAGGNVFAHFDTASTAGQVTLSFTNANGTTPTTALLNEVMQAIRYANTNDDPTANVQIAWTFSDGNSGNAQGTGDNPGTVSGSTTVAVTSVNDAPQLAATGGNPTFVVGSAALDLFSAVTASTVEPADQFASLILTVSNVSDGASEILRIDGSDVPLTDGTTVTTASNGLSVSVSVTGTTATVSFAGASLSNAQMQALVDDLAYQNTSPAPTTGAPREITLAQVTDSGGIANGGVDTTALSLVSTVSVQTVNGAPVLTNLNGDVVELAAGANALIDAGSNATVTEPDTGAFAGGALRIVDKDSNNTAAGSFSFDGGLVKAGADGVIAAGEDVSVNGTTVGTVAAADGQNGQGLTIDFLGAVATQSAIQTLLQNLSWGAAAGTGDQTFNLTLDDNAGTVAGGMSTATAGFTMRLTNAPVITGTAAGSVTEDGTLTAKGTLVATDADAEDTPTFTAQTGTAGTYGSFVLTAGGAWTYTLDNTAAQVLALGQSVTETFTAVAATADGESVSQTVTVTVNGANETPTSIAISNAQADETLPPGTAIGTLSVVDPDPVDSHTLTLLSTAGGLFVLNGTVLSLAPTAVLDFETAPSHEIELRATDTAGASLTQTLTISVNDQPESFVGTSGTSLVPVGPGAETLTLGPGPDTVTGTLEDLFGDTIRNLTPEDQIVLTPASFTRSDVTFDSTTGRVSIDTNGDGTPDGAFTLEGGFSGGDLMVVRQGGNTIVTVQPFVADTAETVALDPTKINGVVNQAFLTGDGTKAYSVHIDSGAIASLSNALGVYEIDESGLIRDTRILDLNVKLNAGNTLSVDGVEAGHTLGFFLLQETVPFPAPLGTLVDSFSFIDGSGAPANAFDGGEIRLALDGTATGQTTIHSFAAHLNAGGSQQVMSGTTAGGEGLTLAFEDVLGGDQDFQDVLITIGLI